MLLLLASALGLPPQAIRIVSGHTAARKIVEIEGITEAEVRRSLKSALQRPSG